MAELLDIAEVVRRTGLTSRALRFWEARGLLKPVRTASGRRFYGPDELERLHAVIALKRAGFSLGAIGGVLGNRRADLGRLVTAQLTELETRARELADTRSLLTQILSRIDSGERIDVATLCSLIRKGPKMEPENWKNVTDRYFSPEEKAHWAERMADVPKDFDVSDYQGQWKALGARIGRRCHSIQPAMPLASCCANGLPFSSPSLRWQLQRCWKARDGSTTGSRNGEHRSAPDFPPRPSGSSRLRPKRILRSGCRRKDSNRRQGFAIPAVGTLKTPPHAALFCGPFGRSETMPWIMPRRL